jgi:zinc D-Ala-D-Ala carboxypeptidase
MKPSKKPFQLSKHFTLEEMTKSMTATRKGINNIPGPGEIKSLGDLCYEVLEPLRAHFDLPVTITSGYRSEALCEAIGSKKTSQHAKGQAVDLEIPSVPNIKVAYWLQNNVDFDQLIMEFYDKEDPAGGWIHISYHESDSNRKQILTFDGKSYSEGLPDMEWADGKVVS